MERLLNEVRRDILEQPKSTIDLEYLYSARAQVQEFADQTNAQLKKNVYQNYSLFIESSREISTLKQEMKQLNTLLDQQLTSMNKLLDQLNKTPVIQSTLDRPKIDSFPLELNDETSEVEAEILPSWFTKSSEDFDVLIAQRNLKEAVELAQRVRRHFEEYPKCCDNRPDLKAKIENRQQELINAISSELQPSTDRSVQGGPRSSISSIKLLRELNLSSRAVKLFLDQRSSVLRFVLSQQKIDSTTTLQFIKQICSIFFHNIVETCNEFKRAFELEEHVNKAIDECVDRLGIDVNRQESDKMLLFDVVRPIYCSKHPNLEIPDQSAYAGLSTTPIANSSSNNDILSQQTEKIVENTFLNVNQYNRNAFLNLSDYASLTFWTSEEFRNFIVLFKKHVFNNRKLSVSMIAESIYHLKNQCSRLAMHCEVDLSRMVERELDKGIKRVVEESERQIMDTIEKLNRDEKWQPQQFQNKAHLTRFFEEMNDVDLKTMPSYVFEDLKLRFTACKTAFARYFLITVSDLAKLVSPTSKSHIDGVLAKAFDLEMQSVVEALEKAKVISRVRFIMGNSNFLLDKVILVADAQYTNITGLKCQKLMDLRAKYQAKVKSIANM